MGEEITNGVSDVLKELYGVLELMTVYILGWCWLSLWWCWTSGHGGWGINEKWIKAESSEDGIYIHFLDEEKIQVSDSVTAVHLTMFVVWTLPYMWRFIDVVDDNDVHHSFGFFNHDFRSACSTLLGVSASYFWDCVHHGFRHMCITPFGKCASYL